MQEAAYDQLLPSERRALHERLRAGDRGAAGGGGAAEASRLVELAHHWTAAHEPARALHAAIEAGDASRAVYAYAEAARQYERAIELWDIVPRRRPAGRPRPGRPVRRRERGGDPRRRRRRAVNLAQRAIELVDAAPGAGLPIRERRARARERLGFAAWLAGDTATSIQLLEEAVELLDGTPPSTARRGSWPGSPQT